MTSISRITPSILNGSSELTVALANLNFDFSLIKASQLSFRLQPHGPPHPLTTEREKNIAENGSVHITARKLGALFEQLLPDTPRLVEAYGTRASDIAKQASSSKSNEPAGFFSGYTGPDGTSIWAAATSGSSAVSVHLLACMLAQVWPPAEAISIWVEIVEGRKRQIGVMAAQPGDGVSLPVLLAGQCVITREQLAEWDNSARAWLRRAEQVMKKPQTQVLLICSNISLSVNARPSTYDNVLEGWKSALQGMEDLLSGQSQMTHDGGLLLALTSWHLYPDMIAFGNTCIRQDDSLFPKGTNVVLGLEATPCHESQGVYWCLPLSHLSYYGDPEVSTRTIGVETSRLTMQQLSCVAYGAMLSSWGVDGRSSVRIAKTLMLYYEQAFGDINDENDATAEPHLWFRVLVKAASSLVQSTGTEREILLKLVQLGRSKKARAFLGDFRKLPPLYFGLGDYNMLISMLRTTEERIECLRHAARRHLQSAPSSHAIIQYFEDALPSEFTPYKRKSAPITGKRAFATALAAAEGSQHYRWTVDSTSQPPPPSQRNVFALERLPESVKTVTLEMKSISRTHSYWAFYGVNPFAQGLGEPDLKIGPEKLEAAESTKSENRSSDTLHVPQILPNTPQILPKSPDVLAQEDYQYTQDVEEDRSTAEEISKNGKPNIEDLKEDEQNNQSTTPHKIDSQEALLDTMTSTPVVSVSESEGDVSTRLQGTPAATNNAKPRVRYSFLIGDPSSAAVYMVDCEDYADMREASKAATAYEIERLLELGCLDKSRMQSAIKSMTVHASTFGYDEFIQSLTAIGMASAVYESVGDGSVTPSIVNRPLHEAKWFKIARSKMRDRNCGPREGARVLQREDIFSCIAYFDHGLDIDVAKFKTVLAISSGDSIFVASALLSDPSEEEASRKVRWILGSVRKPGLALLVPPAAPLCLKPRAEDWKLIGYEPYQGVPTDNFSGATLNMSFTGWRFPVGLGDIQRGQQDIEAYIHETLVSVYDRNKWIADLDVLDAFSKGSFQPNAEFYYRVGCQHPGGGAARLAKKPEVLANEEVATINNWQEFLDHPTGPVIVMAHKNWPARLAAAALAVRRHDRVVVLDEFCWTCLVEFKELKTKEFIERTIFIC